MNSPNEKKNSMEKNADEQHLKNNPKYNLRSHKKEPDKDQASESKKQNKK